MLYAAKQINSSLLEELVFARGTTSLQENYAKKFAEMVSFSIFHVTTATISVETDARQHVESNTDTSARASLIMVGVNVSTTAISTSGSTVSTNLN